MAAVVALVFGIVLPELVRTGTTAVKSPAGTHSLDTAHLSVNQRRLEDSPTLLAYVNDLVSQLDWEALEQPDAGTSPSEETGADPEHLRHRLQPGGRGGATAFIGIVFAFYLLTRKEQLARQCKRLQS